MATRLEKEKYLNILFQKRNPTQSLIQIKSNSTQISKMKPN